MFPDYLDLWAQTNPQPLVEPYLPLFLHGPQAGPADLQVVWRVDLDDDECWQSEKDEAPSALDRVAAVPPSSLEAVGISYAIGKRWLLGQTPSSANVADVDRPLAPKEDETAERTDTNLRAVVWRGDQRFVLEAKSTRGLRPGDTVVIPASRGGLFMDSFDLLATDPVHDVAERASLEGRGKAFLRLHPPLLTCLGLIQVGEHVQVFGDMHPRWLTRLVAALEDATTVRVDDSLDLLTRISHQE
jgi:CRISPR-associated endonuclease/helicase Cas3